MQQVLGLTSLDAPTLSRAMHCCWQRSRFPFERWSWARARRDPPWVSQSLRASLYSSKALSAFLAWLGGYGSGVRVRSLRGWDGWGF